MASAEAFYELWCEVHAVAEDDGEFIYNKVINFHFNLVISSIFG